MDLLLLRNDTFAFAARWEADPLVYKPITGVTRSAPAQLTVVDHGLVNGWPAAVSSVVGMTQINAQHSPPWKTEYHPVTVIDANTLQFNEVNSSLFKDYISGGYVQYASPVDLSGYSAVADLVSMADGSVALSLSTANGKIVLDNAAKLISASIPASETALLALGTYTYRLIMTDLSSTATTILSGTITVADLADVEDALLARRTDTLAIIGPAGWLQNGAHLWKNGVLDVSGTTTQSTIGRAAPLTISLLSTDAGRKIELSADGVNYFEPVYDVNLTGSISVGVIAPVQSVRITGAQNDSWSIQ